MSRNKKIKILLNSARTTLGMIANAVFVCFFVVLTMYAFSRTMNLDIPWNRLLLESEGWQYVFLQILFSPHQVLLIVVAIQYLCHDKPDWKEYALIAILCMLSSRAVGSSGGAYIFTYVLLIAGARRLPFRRLMWIYFLAAGTLCIYTVAASQTGVLEDLVFNARGGRAAYGFIYATDCAAHFLFLALVYWYLRGTRFHYIESVLFLGLAAVAWLGCRARFSTFLLVLTAIIAVLCHYLQKRWGQDRWDQMMAGRFSAFLVLFPMLGSLVIHILSMLYTERWGWIKALNSLTSTRLSLVKRAIDVYGFGLWGNSISMAGNGGETESQAKYYYIDSTFMQISLRQGIVILAVFLVIFSLACLSARRSKEWVLLLVLCVAAIHGLFEHHAFELAYNPFLLAAFAEMKPVRPVRIPLFRRAKSE